MKVVHFSDWHSKPQDLPEADLYVCTGDMIPNFGKIAIGLEGVIQQNWVFDRDWRSHFASSGSQVVCVRGNHDFTNLSPLFKGGPTWEVGEDHTQILEFQGLKIGGWRGVCVIGGYWADEKTEERMERELKFLPDDLDILITHAPPFGILDEFENFHAGSRALLAWVQKHPKLKLHCFGHIHECGLFEEKVGSTIFSNGATGFNEIEV